MVADVFLSLHTYSPLSDVSRQKIFRYPEVISVLVVLLTSLPFLSHTTLLDEFETPHAILLVSPKFGVISLEQQSKNYCKYIKKNLVKYLNKGRFTDFHGNANYRRIY